MKKPEMRTQFSVLLLFTLFAGNAEGSFYFTNYANKHCNNVLTLSTRDYGVLRMSSRNSWQSGDIICTTMLKTSSPDNVLYFDIESSSVCAAQAGGYIRFYDGDSTIRPTLATLYQSSSSFSSIKLRTTGQYLTIEHDLRGTVACNRNSLYKIRYTSQKKGGMCNSYEFRCSNSYCIAKTLKCDGYNNCQDNSDEINCVYGFSGLSTAVKAGIGIGCAAFLVIVVISILCYVRRNREVTTTTTTYNQPPPPVQYSQGYVPQQQPYNQPPPGYPPAGNYPQ